MPHHDSDWQRLRLGDRARGADPDPLARGASGASVHGWCRDQSLAPRHRGNHRTGCPPVSGGPASCFCPGSSPRRHPNASNHVHRANNQPSELTMQFRKGPSGSQFDAQRKGRPSSYCNGHAESPTSLWVKGSRACCVEPPAGFEPATLALQERCSGQLS